MSFSSKERERFTEVIDSILAKSDLNTISEKRIRTGVQETVGYDLTPHKAAIKQLIMERFDVFAAKRDQPPSPVEPSSAAEASNGDQQSQDAVAPAATSSHAGSASPQKRPPDSDELSDLPTKTPPAKKKKKKDDDDDVDADAVYAAKLQAEENMRARPTRGANTRKVAPAKRKTKAKTSKKIKAEDDSDLDSGSETTKKEVKRSGGFHKPLNLSPALSALLDGEMTLSRPQTVKKLWQYIRAHELQDPNDRRQIRCDDAMRAVFKQDRIHMFTMTKILNQNLYSPDE